MVEIAILLVLLLILAVLVDIRTHLRRSVKQVSLPIERLHEGHVLVGAQKGYAIWIWHGGTWRLDSDRCGEGFVPGGPPQRPGKYEGEVVKKPGVPS